MRVFYVTFQRESKMYILLDFYGALKCFIDAVAQGGTLQMSSWFGCLLELEGKKLARSHPSSSLTQSHSCPLPE